MKKLIVIILLFLLTISCEKNDNGFTDGGEPVSVYLIAKWELQRIENIKNPKINIRLDYKEILENGNENGEDFSKVYKNGILMQTHIRARSRGIEMSAKDMTVLDKYRDNTVRFYRIINGNSQNVSIEASGYVEQIGSTADTLKYYYSLAK